MALDSNGLTIRSFDEILEQLETDEKTNVHPDIDTRDDEYLGQMNSIISLFAQEFEQMSQAAIDNLDPDLAEGLWLDKLAREKSVTRLIATPSSTSYQSFTATDGTVIPSGTILKSTVTGDEYNNTADITVDATSCNNAVINVSSVLDSTTYEVTVNGVLYSYPSDGTATALEIVNGLKALIDADTTKTWTAAVDATEVTLAIATSNTSNLNISVISYLAYTSVTALDYVEAIESGAKVGVINTITIISSTVGGLLSTYNTLDMVLGRDLETDVELRIRMYAATNIKSVAVPSAILSRIKDIEGVSVAALTENTTSAIVDSLPPHSYEVVISGGDDDDIASELWLTKPAGIATYGSTSVNVADSEGIQQTLNFTRPSAVNLAFRVTYSVYDEEALSSNIIDVIKDSIVVDTSELGIGKDIIPYRYFGDIYSNSTGISSLKVEVQEIAETGDTPDDSNWDISTLSHCTKTGLFDAASQDTFPTDLFFNPTGTKLYVAGWTNKKIFQYTLSTAYDISTASYDGVAKDYDFSSEVTAVAAMYISPDGLNMYLIGNGLKAIYQYSLSTAWDTSTATYTTDFHIFAEDSLPTGIRFNPSGTILFYIGASSDTIHQYTLSTAWDVSTISYDGAGESFSVATQSTDPAGLHLGLNGTKLFVTDELTNIIFQYTLSTAYDISTASYDSLSYTLESIVTNSKGVFINPAGSEMFMVSWDSTNVVQFSFDTPWQTTPLAISPSEYGATSSNDVEVIAN